nr:immunoglobulin light chain junction region [Macaca mulatta]
CGQGTHCPPTF